MGDGRLFCMAFPMTATPDLLDAFEMLARSRRATRRFRPDPVDPALLERLVQIAPWAPSGYNLQPTHFVLVTDPALRQRLAVACMGQRPVAEAPAVVVLTGDRDVADRHFRLMIQAERNAGSIKPAYEALLNRVVPLAFKRGPLGIGKLWKATLLPVVQLFRPIPEMPAVDMRFWLAKQTSLCAMNLMLAAEAAGLATLPMEGFDEHRVRRVLSIPRSHVVTLVIPIGYPTDDPRNKTRLPLSAVLHRETW